MVAGSTTRKRSSTFFSRRTTSLPKRPRALPTFARSKFVALLLSLAGCGGTQDLSVCRRGLHWVMSGHQFAHEWKIQVRSSILVQASRFPLLSASLQSNHVVPSNFVSANFVLHHLRFHHLHFPLFSLTLGSSTSSLAAASSPIAASAKSLPSFAISQFFLSLLPPTVPSMQVCQAIHRCRHPADQSGSRRARRSSSSSR